MTTEAKMIQVHKEYISPTRRRVMGVVFLLLAASIWLFTRGLEPGVLTTFRMMAGGSNMEVADWIFNTTAALTMLAAFSAALGTYQLARGFAGRTNLVLGLVTAFFLFSF